MQTEWLPVGKVDKKFSYRTYMHPESPNTGVFWLEKPVTFKFLKLTNNKNTIYRDQVREKPLLFNDNTLFLYIFY